MAWGQAIILTNDGMRTDAYMRHSAQRVKNLVFTRYPTTDHSAIS